MAGGLDESVRGSFGAPRGNFGSDRGYDLRGTVEVDVSALKDKADRNRRKQIQFLLKSKRIIESGGSGWEFNLQVAGSIDALNNFRKRVMRSSRDRAQGEAHRTVMRLSGSMTPARSGRTRASSDWRRSNSGSQSFKIEVTQGVANRGYHYAGPLHDHAGNRDGKLFWFARAMDEFRSGVARELNEMAENPAVR